MADYNIGAFRTPSLSGSREDDVIYFADMPVEGGTMCKRGPEGLAIIVWAIQAQLSKKDQQDKLSMYKAWLEGLAEAAEEYERVLIEIEEDELRVATINNVIFRTERAYMLDQEQIAAFLYANNKTPTRRAESEEAASIGLKR